MLERMWDAFKGNRNLIGESRVKALDMLDTSREMLRIVVNAMHDSSDIRIQDRIRLMDQKVNDQQQEVRKMVFEYLVIGQGKNLLEGLQMMIVVNDLERIGDYGKNLGELVDMVPGKLDFHEFEERFNEIQTAVLAMFDMTHKALESDDAEMAKAVMDRYGVIARKCDNVIEEVFLSAKDRELVESWKLGFVLTVRYLKRVGAHLKNVCTAVVNPFHRIGYRSGV